MYCDTPAALKSRMPGAMLEVVTHEPRQAQKVVRELPGVIGVLLVGIGIHVHVDGTDRRAHLAAALGAAGVAVSSIEDVEPTIEDLFVAFLEQKDEREVA